MKLTLKRRFKADTYTIGSLYVNNEYFCDTLEDTDRDLNKNGRFDNGEQKIPEKTAIPYGTYQVIVNVSPKLKRETPRLLNVPHFEGILIHSGNTHQDTEGCILVGENKEKGKVINSKFHEQKLLQLLKGYIAKGEEITITII